MQAPRSDPFAAASSRLSGGPFSQEEIAMALAALGSGNSEEQEVCH